MRTDFTQSLKLCEFLGYAPLEYTRVDMECTNDRCDIEPPAMTSECPRCEFNKRRTKKVQYPVIDFSEPNNFITLMGVFKKLHIPVTMNSGARYTWDVGCCDGVGDTFVGAVNSYVTTLKEFLADEESSEDYKNLENELTTLKNALNQAPWRYTRLN